MFTSNSGFSINFCLFCWLAMLSPASFGQSISDQSIFDQSIEVDSQQLRPISDELPTDTLKNPVKIFFDSSTNQYVLIGAKSDVAIVKRTIQSFNEKFSARSHTVTQKVLLEFQLADQVVEILSNAMSMEANEMSNLNIVALHFPESVLLIGPQASVDNAKRLIKTVDSHPGFSSR